MSPRSVRILRRVVPGASSCSGAVFGSKHALLQRSRGARAANVRHTRRPRGDAAASCIGCLHRRIPNALPAPQITTCVALMTSNAVSGNQATDWEMRPRNLKLQADGRASSETLSVWISLLTLPELRDSAPSLRKLAADNATFLPRQGIAARLA